MLDWYFDRLDDRIDGVADALPSWGRGLVHVAVTMVLVTMLASVARWLLGRLMITMPNVVQCSFARDRRAAYEASELLGRQTQARSVLARNYGDRPPGTTGPALRRWSRARELQAPAEESQLRRWAWLQVFRDRLLATVRWGTAMFGAGPRLRPRNFVKPATLVASIALVFWARPPWRLPSLGVIADSAWTAVTDARASRVLPFVILFLGVLLVARPFPVIDRIRARDEAAKDANKLLAELYGQLTQLYYELYEWREQLLADRHERVAEYVEDVTHHQHSWGAGGGLTGAPHHPFGSARRSFPGPEATGNRVTARVEAIQKLDDTIRDKGLAVVARRLSRRVWDPLFEFGLLSPYPGASRFATAVRAPSALFAPNRALVQIPVVVGSSPPPLTHQLELIESQAFNYARVLDMSIAQIFVAEARLQQIARHLGGRMVGTWWTRTLSIVQK